jgi:hypothetical protein
MALTYMEDKLPEFSGNNFQDFIERALLSCLPPSDRTSEGTREDPGAAHFREKQPAEPLRYTSKKGVHPSVRVLGIEYFGSSKSSEIGSQKKVRFGQLGAARSSQDELIAAGTAAGCAGGTASALLPPPPPSPSSPRPWVLETPFTALVYDRLLWGSNFEHFALEIGLLSSTVSKAKNVQGLLVGICVAYAISNKSQ